MWKAFNRFQASQVAKTRLELFSDAIFAIVITLLILDIKTPHGLESDVHIIHQLYEILPNIFSWIISFFLVAAIWAKHHHILHRAKRVDMVTLWLNIIHLFFVSFIPVPTALLGAHLNSRIAITFFALIMAAIVLTLNLMRLYIERYLTDEAHEIPWSKAVYWIAMNMGPFILAAGIAWVNRPFAYAILILTPIYFLIRKDKNA